MSQARTTPGAGGVEASKVAAPPGAPASPEGHVIGATMEPVRGPPSGAAEFHQTSSASSSPWSLRPGFVGSSAFASASSSSPLSSPTSSSRRGGRVAYVPIVASPAHMPAGTGPAMATAAIVPASATMAMAGGGTPKEVPMAWASSTRDEPLRQVAARQPATSTPTNQAASATAAHSLGASASTASASSVDFAFSPSSSASSTPLPSPVTAAGSSSSRTSAHDPIGSPSLLQFRLDPNSPQMKSSRPLPRVIHRASNIAAGAAAAAGASPSAAAAGGVVVVKADAKKDTHSPVMAVRARPVPNVSAAISSTKPLVGFFEAKGQIHSPPVSSRAAPAATLTIPTSGLTPTNASSSPANILIDHSPPAWHRAHSHAGGEDPYAPTSAPAFPTMVVGTPTRPPTAGSPQSQLHGKQSAQRNLLGLHYDEPAVDLKPDGASLLDALQAARNNASPSPSSSQKRAHQSWSVPARGSISGGQAGFSSSSFRPMLQKDLYLSGAAPTSPTHQHNNSQPSLSPIQPQPSPRHRSSLSQSGSSSVSGYSAGTSSRPSPTHGGGGGAVAKDGGKLSNVTEGLEMGEVRLHIDGLDRYPTPSPRSSISSGEGRARSPSAAGTASGKALNLPRSPVQGHGSGSGGALPRKPLEETPAGQAHRFGRPEKATPGSAADERTAMVRVASPSWHERFRHRLNHFPTQIPYSKAIALSLLHPAYTVVAFLLTLVAVFALDFQLAFFVDTSTRACDVLLLIIGCTWVAEFVALSLVLPGYLLHHFQWYMDVVAILSLAVDISALDGLGMDARVAYRPEANSNWTESTTFHGLTDSGSSKVWLFLHLARLVRLFKYWNGIEAFAGKIDLKALYMRIAARGHPGAAASSVSSHVHGSGPFFKSSTLGLHLTNKFQKKQTLVLLVAIMLFTLLAPTQVRVNNNDACVNGALTVNGPSSTAPSFSAYTSMEQWTVAHMNALYTQAVKESELALAAATTAGDTATTMASLLEAHASYRSAHTMAASMRASFGEKLLVLSLSAPDTTYPKPTMFFPANLASGMRSFEVTTYQCGGALLLMSNAARVHEVAVWNILLLLFLFLLFLLAQSYTAYTLATTISAPLERMSKVVRKMAGTVMFLQPTDGDADRDPWEARRGSKSSASGGGNASSSPKCGIVGPGGRALSASSSSWYLTNRTSATSILSFGSSCGSGGSLSGWVPPAVPPHREFDLLEEVVTKMASVFNLLPGGLASLITDSSSGGEGQEKARRMMVGSRRTELKTRDSILTIDVVERPITANAPSVHKDGGGHHHHGSSSGAGAHHDRPGSSRAFGFGVHGAKGAGSERLSEADAQQKQHNDEFFSSSTLLNLPASPLHGGGRGGIHPQLVLSTMQNPAGRASIHHALAQDSELRFESHPELKSLEDLLQDPFASIHFKSYLHKKFCLETISFYEQVAKYKARMQSWAFRIYHQFVVAGAPNEINIHSAQRQAISSEIFHPTLETFNAAQKEVYKLMKNNFLEFLVSQGALDYMRAKQQQQLSIKVSEDQM